MNKNILIYGAIAGVVVAIGMFANLMLFEGQENPDYAKGELIGYASMLVAFSTIFFAVRSYRIFNDGFISFAQALKIGLGVTIVASLIYMIAWMTMGPILAPDFTESYYEYNLEQIRNSDKSEAEIQQQIESMESQRETFENPVLQSLITFMEIFPVGLVVSLVVAAVLKKKNPEQLEMSN